MTWIQFGIPFKPVESITFVRLLDNSEHVFTSNLSYSCSFLHSRTILVSRTLNSLSSRICFGHLRPYSLISISLYLFVVIFTFHTHTITQLISGIIHTHSHRASSQTVKTKSIEGLRDLACSLWVASYHSHP